VSSRRWTSLPGGRTALAIMYVATLGLLGVAFLAARLLDRPLSDFTRDPVQVLGGAPLYVGSLSTLGTLLWAGAAGACLVVAATLSRLRHPDAELLFAAGAVSALLAADDIFLFHERAGSLGVPQVAVAAGYGVVLGLFVVRYRDSLRRTQWKLLGAAAAFLAASAFLDWFAEVTETGLAYDGLEDAIKLVGVVTWTAYFAGLAVESLLRAVPSPPMPRP